MSNETLDLNTTDDNNGRSRCVCIYIVLPDIHLSLVSVDTESDRMTSGTKEEQETFRGKDST